MEGIDHVDRSMVYYGIQLLIIMETLMARSFIIIYITDFDISVRRHRRINNNLSLNVLISLVVLEFRLVRT